MTHTTTIVLIFTAVFAADRAAATVPTYPYQSCFETAAALHDVELDLLLAVAATESSWDPDARSHANAHGIMQIQWPGTARHLGVRRIAELYNPCLNIELGARYLRELLDSKGGDLTRALAAYNYGPTRIAASPELPAGALHYVATVEAHRTRIREGSRIDPRAAEQAGGLMRFDQAYRAERYAATMNTRIRGAEFFVTPLPAGGHAVRMAVGAEGLSATDVTTLDLLGWPEAER